MLAESDFTQDNIAELLGEWRSEDEIWGDPNRAMRLEDIVEAERDLLTPDPSPDYSYINLVARCLLMGGTTVEGL
jgi:hypothetical protein